MTKKSICLSSIFLLLLSCTTDDIFDGTFLSSKPEENSTAAKESKPIKNPTPSEEFKPIENPTPSEEFKPIENPTPSEESKPIENSTAAEESKPKKRSTASRKSKSKKRSTASEKSKSKENSKPIEHSTAAEESTNKSPKKERPVVIGFVNSGGEKGRHVYKTLLGQFKKSKHFEVVPESRILERAKKYNLTLDDFQLSGKREKRKEDLKKLIKDEKLESLYILDVYDGGKKARLVVISPDGNEVVVKEKEIKGGKISEKDADSFIDDTRQKLDESVKEFRAKGGYKKETTPAENQTKPVEKKSESKEEKSHSTLGNTGYFDLGAAFMVGATSAKIEDHSGNKVSYVGIYTAPLITLKSTFWQNDDISIGASAIGAFAPYKSKNDRGESTIKSWMAWAQLQIDLGLKLGEGAWLLPNVGVDYRELRIGKEITYYNGSRYLGMICGLRFNGSYKRFSFDLGVGVVPSFMTQISKKSYGKSTFAINYTGRFQAQYEIIDLLDFFVGYDFRFVTVELQGQTSYMAALATYQEMNHGAWIGLKLSL